LKNTKTENANASLAKAAVQFSEMTFELKSTPINNLQIVSNNFNERLKTKITRKSEQKNRH
jgi:hypothetical protein